MQNDFAIYREGMFSTCAHEFFNTALAKKYQDRIEVSVRLKKVLKGNYGEENIL